MKTKDCYEIEVGMWLSDETGTYEIKDIRKNSVIAKEVIFGDDYDDYAENFHYGNDVILKEQDIKELSYI